MNQIFNINRFGNLFWRSLVQYKYTYIRLSLVCLATFIILGFLSVVFGVGTMNLYIIMINLFITIAPAAIFFKRRTHTSHIFEFTLPASVLEKFLVKFFNCTLIFPVYIIGLSFIFVGVAMVAPVDFINNAGQRLYTLLIEKTISQYWNIIAVQSIFLCGSYFFKNIVFVKVVLILMGISIIALIMTFVGVFSAFDFSSGPIIYSGSFGIDDPADLFKSSSSYIRNMLYVIQYFIPVGLWFASFFKLKETEI